MKDLPQAADAQGISNQIALQAAFVKVAKTYHEPIVLEAQSEILSHNHLQPASQYRLGARLIPRFLAHLPKRAL